MLPPLPPGKHAAGSVQDERTDWFQQIAASLGIICVGQKKFDIFPICSKLLHSEAIRRQPLSWFLL
jgi:hypothetical protein